MLAHKPVLRWSEAMGDDIPNHSLACESHLLSFDASQSTLVAKLYGMVHNLQFASTISFFLFSLPFF
jgi:hypothetical protein